MRKEKKLSKDYEHQNVFLLEGTESKHIRIPSSIILDTDMRSNRVAIFAYLSIYKGLHSKMYLSIPNILKWAGYKSDTHSGGTNDKFLETLDNLNEKDYLIYMGDVTRTSCFEVEFNTQQVHDECSRSSFAILYIDEIERIMKYKNNNIKDVHLNNVNVLLVFAFLRHAIYRIPNKLKPEHRNSEGIKKRREKFVEAYANTYKDIAYQVGLSERTVSKAVDILIELKLIVTDECYHIKNDKGEYKTPYTLFSNYEKRDGKYLVLEGLDYARGELERKAKKIQEFNPNFMINKNKRSNRYDN